jgi:hypothetical protein
MATVDNQTTYPSRAHQIAGSGCFFLSWLVMQGRER